MKINYNKLHSIINTVQDVHYRINQVWKDAIYAVMFRTIRRNHIIHTRLKPGYIDNSDRIFHGMFELLIDFVEIEKAWMHYICEIYPTTKKTWFHKFYTKYISRRNPNYGLQYLKWEISLDSSTLNSNQRSYNQAHAAREIWDLYHWWKHIRPNRIDPMDSSGWTEWQTKHKGLFSKLTIADQLKERQILAKCTEIENQYDNEDTEQLIRLINIRGSLWT